ASPPTSARRAGPAPGTVGGSVCVCANETAAQSSTPASTPAPQRPRRKRRPVKRCKTKRSILFNFTFERFLSFVDTCGMYAITTGRVTDERPRLSETHRKLASPHVTGRSANHAWGRALLLISPRTVHPTAHRRCARRRV